MLTDTHCHLFYDDLKNDLPAVLHRASKLGVNRFICVATNLGDAKECLQLAEQYQNIYASAGIHPHDAKDAPKNFVDQIYDFLSHHSLSQHSLIHFPILHCHYHVGKESNDLGY